MAVWTCLLATHDYKRPEESCIHDAFVVINTKRGSIVLVLRHSFFSLGGTRHLLKIAVMALTMSHSSDVTPQDRGGVW